MILVFAFFLSMTLFFSVRRVSKAEAVVVERLGKFHTVWYEGIHIRIPFVERVRKVFPLDEQTTGIDDYAPASDHILIADLSIRFLVCDPQKAAYSKKNLHLALNDTALAELRVATEDITAQNALASFDSIQSFVWGRLVAAGNDLGVRVTGFEISRFFKMGYPETPKFEGGASLTSKCPDCDQPYIGDYCSNCEHNLWNEDLQLSAKNVTSKNGRVGIKIKDNTKLCIIIHVIWMLIVPLGIFIIVLRSSYDLVFGFLVLLMGLLSLFNGFWVVENPGVWQWYRKKKIRFRWVLGQDKRTAILLGVLFLFAGFVSLLLRCLDFLQILT